MHFCGIILKEKEMSVKDARELFGEELVNRQIADWYSSDNYRERTFNDKQVISLNEFKELFNSDWAANAEKQLQRFTNDGKNEDEKVKCFEPELWVFGIVEDGYVSSLLEGDNMFFDFFEYGSKADEELEKKRKQLSILYTEAYLIKTKKILNELDNDKYDVCLIDYHN